jgi:hypothetical protein
MSNAGTSYLSDMIDRCQRLEEASADGNMRTFWHNAGMGFRLRKVLKESRENGCKESKNKL